MARTLSFAKYCLIAAAAGACAAAIALRPPGHQVAGMVPTGQPVAYLDCAVVQRDRVPDPDLVAPCSMLA